MRLLGWWWSVDGCGVVWCGVVWNSTSQVNPRGATATGEGKAGRGEASSAEDAGEGTGSWGRGWSADGIGTGGCRGARVSRSLVALSLAPVPVRPSRRRSQGRQAVAFRSNGNATLLWKRRGGELSHQLVGIGTGRARLALLLTHDLTTTSTVKKKPSLLTGYFL
jgi:hypothetical protein